MVSPSLVDENLGSSSLITRQIYASFIIRKDTSGFIRKGKTGKPIGKRPLFIELFA